MAGSSMKATVIGEMSIIGNLANYTVPKGTTFYVTSLSEESRYVRVQDGPYKGLILHYHSPNIKLEDK